VTTIYITSGLAEVLLSMAADREPQEVSVSIAVTPAGEFDDLDLPAETPVFTHLYLPEAGGSVNAVFGVDLGTPAGDAQGRFVSHPDGRPELRQTDDLREVVLVAVPPWDISCLAAFDRSGRTRDLELLDAEPPDEPLL